MIAPNTIVGNRYRVVKPLGGGGMKLVYLAEDLRLAARRCALAEVVDNFTNPDSQRQAVAAFQREADMLARLNNEHIPRVFDRFSEQNHHYLVMEYIDGVTLEDEMKRAGGRLPEARVIDVALQILDTLEYLHGLAPPVIYRDLKPSNVMLTDDGQAKLIDFGIARHFQPEQNVTMIGTQGYAPPEQYRGKVELRSDLYALGATMHHALTARDPANEAPFSFPPLATLSPEVEPALGALVDEALAYDVGLRVASASEFRRRLEAIRNGGAPAAMTTLSSGMASGSTEDTNADATASPPTAGSASGAKPARAQLRLPLEAGGAAATPSSASAPTVLSINNDVPCPKCARPIPSDSRFCSFCGADLSVMLASGEVATNHEADTVVLSVPPAMRQHAAPNTSPAAGHARALRRPLVILILIFASAFAAVKAVSCLNATVGGSSAGNRAAAPPVAPVAPAYPRYGASPPARPGFLAARLSAFRQALNMSGYSGVKFRMVGDTMVLWGTVPTPTDRAMVQMMAANIVGVVSLDDRLTVQRALAGP